MPGNEATSILEWNGMIMYTSRIALYVVPDLGIAIREIFFPKQHNHDSTNTLFIISGY